MELDELLRSLSRTQRKLILPTIILTYQRPGFDRILRIRDLFPRSAAAIICCARVKSAAAAPSSALFLAAKYEGGKDGRNLEHCRTILYRHCCAFSGADRFKLFSARRCGGAAVGGQHRPGLSGTDCPGPVQPPSGTAHCRKPGQRILSWAFLDCLAWRCWC